jgi:hypothetical protein
MSYTINQIGQAVKRKYPGAYDSLSDDEVGQAFINKHPEYNQIVSTTQHSQTLEDTAPNTQRKSVGGFVENTVKSGMNFVKNVAQTVAHPIQTAKTLIGTGAGVVEKAIPGQQGQEHYANDLGQMLKERYGNWDKVKNTAYTDPIGFLADVATLLDGAGAAFSAAGKVSDVSKLSKAAEIAKSAARVADPLTGPTEVAKGAVPSRVAGKAASQLYQSSLKPSTARYTTAERAKMVNAGLEERIPVSKTGLQESVDRLHEVNDKIDEVIAKARKAGSTVSLNEMLKPLDDVREFYKTSYTPS